MKRLFPLLFSLLLLLGGCTSYHARIDPAHKLDDVQRFFVVANANDNRGLGHRLVAALRARGFTAETGPHTMMADNVQAVVAYQDHWAWDFGDHLVYLEITVRGIRTQQPIATATFSAKIPGRKTPAEIVDELVDRLAPRKNS